MNIKSDCLVCLYNQALKTSKLLELDEETTSKILFEIAKILPNYSLDNTAPEIAKDTYHIIEILTNNNDPLKTIKEKSIQEAKKVEKILYQKINNSNDKLLTALKIAVAGNVIDFGAKEQIELNTILNKIFDTDFAIDDYSIFKKRLNQSKKIVILGDNCGENILDTILASILKQFYDIELFYFVRGKPIINDVTYKEALNSDMTKFATIIDSGVPTPGYSLKYASKESLKIFQEADMIISKGMGNFESLYNIYLDKNNRLKGKEIFYLFVVKCNVIADAIKKSVGDIIFKRGIL